MWAPQVNVHPVPADGNGRRKFALGDSPDSTEREAGEVRAPVAQFRVADAIPRRDFNIRRRRHSHVQAAVGHIPHDQGVGPKPVEGNKPVTGRGLARYFH